MCNILLDMIILIGKKKVMYISGSCLIWNVAMRLRYDKLLSC